MIFRNKVFERSCGHKHVMIVLSIIEKVLIYGIFNGKEWAETSEIQIWIFYYLIKNSKKRSIFGNCFEFRFKTQENIFEIQI